MSHKLQNGKSVWSCFSLGSRALFIIQMHICGFLDYPSVDKLQVYFFFCFQALDTYKRPKPLRQWPTYRVHSAAFMPGLDKRLSCAKPAVPQQGAWIWASIAVTDITTTIATAKWHHPPQSPSWITLPVKGQVSCPRSVSNTLKLRDANLDTCRGICTQCCTPSSQQF